MLGGEELKTPSKHLSPVQPLEPSHVKPQETKYSHKDQFGFSTHQTVRVKKWLVYTLHNCLLESLSCNNRELEQRAGWGGYVVTFAVHRKSNKIILIVPAKMEEEAECQKFTSILNKMTHIRKVSKSEDNKEGKTAATN